ncbi:hypothetical protein OAP09_01485 [Acidimicrobiia bacterium]|nr:hypothetical protein [Acidimicrobiia bacterium]MDC0595340.1 hypothetical protein [Acidimicrobiia bacterium]
MIKQFLKLSILGLSNYLVIFLSSDIDIEQLVKDFEKVNIYITKSNVVYFIICSIVPIVTLLLIQFFKPFIEMYLTHYLKYNFYFLINLLSLSTVYMVFRIYGYSRFYLLMYLISSTLFLNLADKYFR